MATDDTADSSDCTNDLTNDLNGTEEVAFKVYYTSGITIMTVICMCGNMLVIRCILAYKTLRNVNNLLILSLAISDGIQGITFFPYNLSHIFKDSDDPVGPCNIIIFFVCFPQLVSAYTLVGITVVRLLAVQSPLKHQMRIRNNKKRMYFFIVSIWLLGITLASVLYLVLYPHESEHGYYSECRYELHFEYMHAAWGLLFFSLGVPAGLMICMYVAIICIYRKHMKLIGGFRRHSSNSTMSAAQINTDYRLAQTAGILIGYFIVSWSPNYLYVFLFTLCRCNTDCTHNDIPWLRATLRMLCFSNSAINVFIYAGRNMEIRKALKRELRRVLCCVPVSVTHIQAAIVARRVQSKVYSLEQAAAPPQTNNQHVAPTALVESDKVSQSNQSRSNTNKFEDLSVIKLQRSKNYRSLHVSTALMLSLKRKKHHSLNELVSLDSATVHRRNST